MELTTDHIVQAIVGDNEETLQAMAVSEEVDVNPLSQYVLDKIVEALVQRNDADKIGRLLTAIAGYPPVGAILPAQVPRTRVLAGADDPLVSVAGARGLAEKLNGDCRLLEHTGHSIPAEAPERLLEEIAEFFELNTKGYLMGEPE